MRYGLVSVAFGLLTPFLAIPKEPGSEKRGDAAPPLLSFVADPRLEPDVEKWVARLKQQQEKKRVKQFRFATINFPVLRAKSDDPFQVSLPLFGEKPAVCVLTRVPPPAAIPEGPAPEAWVGHLKEVKGSSVTLTRSEDSLFGEIRTLNDVYQIRPTPASKPPLLHVLIEVNEAGFPSDDHPARPSPKPDDKKKEPK